MSSSIAASQPSSGASAPARSAARRWPAPPTGALLPALALAGWELASRAGCLPENWFPAPSSVARSLFLLLASGELLRHIAASLVRVGLGFALGSAAATLLGVLNGRSRRLHAWMDPSLQALRSLPSLAWVPLFLLWFGIGETSKVLLIAFGAFFPVYLNLSSGLRAIDVRWLEVAQLFGYRGWRLVRHVLLPAVLPSYVTGLRSGLGLAWMFVVAAELMGASRGLGYLLVDGQTTSRPELILGALLLFAILGKLSDGLLERLARR